jgi:hypothetical protein
MIYRIIDKETKTFKRDDSVWNIESEEAISTPCPQGFSNPKWIQYDIAINGDENEQLHDSQIGEWIEGA